MTTINTCIAMIRLRLTHAHLARQSAMTDLFAQSEAANLEQVQPLAARMRPGIARRVRRPAAFLGRRQTAVADAAGHGGSARSSSTVRPASARQRSPACWPQETDSRFRQLSAVTSGVKDVREILDEARDEVAAGGRPTLLMIDEIHRFNRAQQDALLPDVEEGVVILVGITTSNPFFAVNDALVSRSRVFEFQPLSVDDIKTLVRRALADKDRGLGQYDATIDDDALEFLAEVSDGDARRALGALEVAVCLQSDRAPASRLAAHAPTSSPTPSSARPSATTPPATTTTTPPAPSSKASAAATPTPASTGSPACSKGARTSASSPAGS